MRDEHLDYWRPSHDYRQDQRQPGEARTLWVIAITAAMMVVEISAGLMFGSMALLADGLHMASHTVALGISAFAYIYARQHAHDQRYSFGTGKVNTLGGYTGALLLAGFSLAMIWESTNRLINPVAIQFNWAIAVAVAGLIVNGASVWILGVDHHHDHKDHNLLSAYYHVLADALTSILAIIALLTAKFMGAVWLDPVIGIVGGLIVAYWAWGLLKSTSAILLDEQGPQTLRDTIVESLEIKNHTRVVDIHLWSAGPNVSYLLLSLVSKSPKPPNYYKSQLPDHIKIDHITIEVHPFHTEHRYLKEAGHDHDEL